MGLFAILGGFGVSIGLIMIGVGVFIVNIPGGLPLFYGVPQMLLATLIVGFVCFGLESLTGGY